VVVRDVSFRREPGTVVPECSPQLEDRESHNLLGHRHVAPDGVEQRLLAHPLAGMLREVLQHGEGLGAKRHGGRFSPQDASQQIELEWWAVDEVRMLPPDRGRMPW
jgi:hypothetical protein